MNKNIFFILFVLLTTSFCWSAEQTYYVNPQTSPSLTIVENANVIANMYWYHIENEYNRTICMAKEAVVNDSVKEFIASENDYLQTDKISLTWDFREDNGKESKDGVYYLILKETNRRNKTKSISHKYTIHLDRKKPLISASLSKTKVFKNKSDVFTILMGKNSEKANMWRVLLDGQHVLYESNLSKNETVSFPIGIGLSYFEYRDLPEGPHEIKIIAKDCAGNTTEKQLLFDVGVHPLRLNIFSSSNGIIYNLDKSVSPIKYIGTGIIGNYWETTIKDNFGVVHFSGVYQNEFDVTCSPFVWDGISSLTGTRVPEGEYMIEMLCRDSTGNEMSGNFPFYVSKEKIRDVNYGKPPFISGRYIDNGFKLQLTNYKDVVSSAVLFVSKDGNIIKDIQIEDVNQIFWDGTDIEDKSVLSTWEDYDFELKVTNTDGKEESFKTTVRTALVCSGASDTQRKIKINSIYFDPNESDIFRENMFFSANSKSLQKIANALLLQMSENDVLILAGNANYTTYPNATLMQKEEKALIRLSSKRAQIVKKILVFYGLPENKIVIKANGGDAYEVLPSSSNNWRNRRVDFFIETKGD